MQKPEANHNGGEVENVTLSKEEYEAVIAERDSLKSAVGNTVEELKELRKKNADLSSELAGKTEIPPKETKTLEVPGSTPDVEKLVQAALEKRERESAEMLFKQTSDSFLASHNEFSKENDASGAKLEEFQTVLSRINLNGLRTESEFKTALEDAYNLFRIKAQDSTMDNFQLAPRGGGTAPRIVKNSHLTPQEEKVVKNYFNGDVDAYEKKKAKHPMYMEEVLRYVE